MLFFTSICTTANVILIYIEEVNIALHFRHKRTHTHALSHTHTHTHTHSLSHAHTLSHTHTHTLTHTHTHTHTLSHTHTHAHTHSACLSGPDHLTLTDGIMTRIYKLICSAGLICIFSVTLYAVLAPSVCDSHSTGRQTLTNTPACFIAVLKDGKLSALLYTNTLLTVYGKKTAAAVDRILP